MPSSRSSTSNTSIYLCCLLRQCSFCASGDPMPLPTNHVTIFPMKMRRICTILTWFGLLLLFTFVLFNVIQVLRAIVSKLPQQPSVQKIVLDFEQAVWPAPREVLPGVQISGCSFHRNQAMWRKVSIKNPSS